MIPKVTLAISVYKVESFIERCVRSLFEQTFEDIEFLFIDDCSPDRSMEIMWQVLEEYPNRKSQVRIVRHESNQGTAITKSECYQLAHGEYVLVIDSDDYAELNAVEAMYNKAKETNADIVVCDVRSYSSKGDRVITLVPNGVHGDGENVKDDIINHYVTPGLWCKLIRTSLFHDNKIVWLAGDFAEDYVISVQTAFYAKRIAAVELPLYHYCYNQDSICNRESESHRVKVLREYKDNLDIVIQFLQDHGVADKYEHGIFMCKLGVRARIQPLLGQCKYRRMWLKTYPELNCTFLFGDKYRKPSYRERFWLIAFSAGLYPKYRKYIYSKRLRPRLEWQIRGW